MLIFEGGEKVKIADFGFARSISTNSIKSKNLGHEGYQAPEDLLGRPPSDKSDVYALGASLHFMLTKKTPDIYDNVKKGIFNIPA